MADKIKTQVVCYIPGALTLVLLLSGAIVFQTMAKSKTPGFHKIDGLFEPSGVVQLNDGRLLAVEDEPTNPFILLSLIPEADSFSISNLRPNTLLHPAMGQVNDLEGIAKNPGGQIYAITSHSRKNNGKRDRAREKIIQFSIEGDRLVASNVRTDFRKKLIRAFPELKDAAKERDVKKDNGLNIEGLTFSPEGDLLWVGLRAPLIADNAILITLLNPHAALVDDEAFRFGENPVFLDLDGGGIRDIAYDPSLSGYLVLSQRENTKKEKNFKLWLWNGKPETAPQRVRISGIKKLKSTEGIAPVRLNGKDQLLLLNDDGNRKRDKPASYLLVDYTRLSIEAKR